MPTPDKADLIEQMLSAERLRRMESGRVTKPLSEWLRDSLRLGLLFGRHDEPLDAYGQRLVRVILTEAEAAEGATDHAIVKSVDEQPAIGSASNLPSSSPPSPETAAETLIALAFEYARANKAEATCARLEAELTQARKLAEERLERAERLQAEVNGWSD